MPDPLSDAALRVMAMKVAPEISLLAESPNTEDLPRYLFDLLRSVREAQQGQFLHTLERIEQEPHAIGCRGIERESLCDCHVVIASAAIRQEEGR